MSQMRLNPLTGRWVTIVTERAERPSDFAPRTREVENDPDRPCPFCPGRDDATPPALETVDAGGQWRMRVVPNLYPAFEGGAAFVVHHLGPVHVAAEAGGIHEVFVYTPDHEGGLDRLSSAGWRSTPPRRASATRRSSSTTVGRPAPRSSTRTPRSSACRSSRARSSRRSGPSPASPAAA
jgi:hypothetical protein